MLSDNVRHDGQISFGHQVKLSYHGTTTKITYSGKILVALEKKYNHKYFLVIILKIS